jgi:hypothetical protein
MQTTFDLMGGNQKPRAARGTFPIDLLPQSGHPEVRSCHGRHPGTRASQEHGLPRDKEVVAETPPAGAKLITRRSQGPWPAAWAGESWPRYKIGDPRPFEPRISLCPITRFQPEFRAIAMLWSHSDAGPITTWSQVRVVGAKLPPNRSPSGSRLTALDDSSTADMFG